MTKFAAIKPGRAAGVLLMLAAALVLSGCTRGMSDLRDWVAQEKARKGQPIQPLPVIKTFETFKYNDQDRRDPFSPSATEMESNGATASSGPRPDADRAKEPLEAFALDSLKMVGTIGTGPGAIALVKDPSRVIHQVHRNEYMGQNYGRVTAISEDHIELVELISNGNGGWMERPASIALGEQ
ncbi:fimbrial protein [Rhodanobacter sp. Root480]|jgi:type IV pilus assembly protein PilP|uniref:Pilus assembly protein PilP n=2 Tax=Rhodanobacter TaxID=75309 RepID=I4VS65_9GAMM|nr:MULTISPECIES: pilus assembly protein PilP [Rhodanobacter]EIL90056.1 Pilus assembly protein PilP [Rhodanobacter fulvus Jip2]KQX96509.1 fimbrial protein [Rhodanobacter sp. Root480]KRA31629.1 fimbrial protein [Rhodanobacter sp. Root627]